VVTGHDVDARCSQLHRPRESARETREVQTEGSIVRHLSTVLVLVSLLCLVAPLEAGVEGAPKNIIFLIGDGMGIAHVTAAQIEAGNLNLERLPVGGFVTTYPENALVTDSAAAGTALATGHKTYNGAISVSGSGETFKTVAEHAEERGMATGLVVTCSITHATPAAFAAHIDHRDREREIARQLAESGTDVLFGGGRSYFLPTGQPGGTRTDGLNLVELMRERMPVVTTPEAFRELGDVDAAAALFYPAHPPRVRDREPDLAELTRKALEILARDEDGFFLMVEGSQIDWAGHENKHDWLIAEMLDFDAAVGVALDFAEKDGTTLVVVSSDHETGAYAVIDGSLDDHEVTIPRFCSDSHTASMVPLLATGPGSEAFGGIRDNTYVGTTMIHYIAGD
jgi:alkaline phosphatase